MNPACCHGKFLNWNILHELMHPVLRCEAFPDTLPLWPYSNLETQICWLTISVIIGHILVKLCTSIICIDIYVQNYRPEMFAHMTSLNLVLISTLGPPYRSDVLSIHWSHCSMDIHGINNMKCWRNLSYYNMDICCKHTHFQDLRFYYWNATRKLDWKTDRTSMTEVAEVNVGEKNVRRSKMWVFDHQVKWEIISKSENVHVLYLHLIQLYWNILHFWAHSISRVT